MNTRRIFLTMIGVASMLLGLTAPALASAQDETVTYKADLSALNSDVTGSDASGDATFTISGDDLTIKVEMEGVAPDTVHLQHFHGFQDGDQNSVCPTVDDDGNGDGIIDIIETEPVAGVTMVPFHDDPVSMEIENDTYPTADADGTYTYEKTVSLSELEDAFAEEFPGQELDLERRVVFIHSVPDDTDLPNTVESLGDIPAHVTLPVACGAIEIVTGGTPAAATPVGSPEATPSS